jgi:hypothetical protein
MKIIIQTQKQENNSYVAMIDGGWWITYGKTKEQAIKAVIKRMEDELEHLL